MTLEGCSLVLEGHGLGVDVCGLVLDGLSLEGCGLVLEGHGLGHGVVTLSSKA